MSARQTGRAGSPADRAGSADLTAGPAVTVRIPATSANLGPGFDSLGLALEIFTTVRVGTSDRLRVDHRGEGEGAVPLDEKNLIYRTFARYFETVGRAVPTVDLAVETEIPLARGLGSSAAAVVAGLYAGSAYDAALGNAALGCPDLLAIACEIEGHPDNVCPALIGGCVVCVRDEDRLVSFEVPLPEDLAAIVFVPDQLMSTADARRILPAQVTRADAVYNIGRAALLVGALATDRLEYLRAATQDRLHQPHRQAIFPAMADLFAGALEAGALGVFLSGSGSSILALARVGQAPAVAAGFAQTADRLGLAGGQPRITRPCRQGAHIVTEAVGSRQ